MEPRRALVLAPQLPEFDRESGSQRTLTLIEMLLEQGWEVTFGSAIPNRVERYVRMLEQMGVETHAPLKDLDDIASGSFDLVTITFWHLAEQHLPTLRKMFPSARIMVDTVDLHFVREARRHLSARANGSGPGQLDRGYAADLVRELNTYSAADGLLAVSPKEAASINDLFGDPAFAHPFPDCEELEPSGVRFRDRRGVVFIGNFRHNPNRDAAWYLCQEIVPRLDPALLREHEVLIVGNELDDEIRSFADGIEHVRMVGWVPSVVTYLERARVSVIPLRYGAGTKRKLIQALMVGTPTVTSTIGTEGLGVAHREHVLVADDADGFAASIELLLGDRSRWKRLARKGRKHIGVMHGRATVRDRLLTAVDAVMSRAPAPPLRNLNSELRVQPRSPEYERLIKRVRDVIQSELPEGSTILIASKGDEAFLDIGDRVAWHFPQADDGVYAGHHPADSQEAIRHLEELRARGGRYLVLPNSAFWWLAYYREFQKHLDENYRRFWNGNYLIMYDLEGAGGRPNADRSQRRQPSKPAITADGAAGGGNGRGDQDARIRVTPELIERLRPAVTPAIASRWGGSARSRRALVLGVYLAGKPNTVEHIVATLGDSEEVELRQRWVALGGDPPSPEVAAVTARVVRERASKYQLLNQLIEEETLDDYDFVVTADDDVVIPRGFLDVFLGIQSELDFAIAQPARTENSHVDLPIVLRQRGVVARQTLFVEIGPVASFERGAFDVVLPFDVENEMGWGFENVWSYELAQRGRKMGIIDAAPVDHSIRKPVEHYNWSTAVEQREAYLARHRHRPLPECFRVLDVIGMNG